MNDWNVWKDWNIWNVWKDWNVCNNWMPLEGLECPVECPVEHTDGFLEDLLAFYA